VDVNWRAIPAGKFPYQIRQIPGPRNPLGRIKLELPNRFDVYLHDTPGKAAFAGPARALSHGCVRVEQILPLASYALNADLNAEEQISQALGTGQTQYIPLQRRLPVYFLYWTAFPDAQGKIQFRPDIYGRDRRLIAALHGGAQRISGDIRPCPKG
jgi:L,D-transpeptidase YcbB